MYFVWLTSEREGEKEEVRKICLDYTVTGLKTIATLPRAEWKPFRFVYVSSTKAERGQSKKPWILGDYTLMCVSFPPYILLT